MKKILSIIIGVTFLFSTNFANAFNFVNLGENEFYYGTIFGEKQDGKSIFLLKDKNGKIHQLFSSQLAVEIENLFKGKNNIKILGQSYENPNNKKYAGIFVNKIRNLDIKETVKSKEITELSENEKVLVYFYLVSNNSKNKFLEGKKIFGDIDLNSIYKEMDEKSGKGEINSEFLEFVKLLSTDEELNLKSEKFLEIKKTTENFKSLDKKILGEVEKIGLNEVKNIFFTKKARSDEEKFFYNELKNLDGFENFLNKKISAKSAENLEIFNFKNILGYNSKDLKIKFLFQNFGILETIFSQKNSEITTKDFFEQIKNKIIFTEIYSNIKIDKNQNLKNSETKLKDFLKENKSEEILKTSLSRDFQTINFEGFKINFPQNFDFQEIKIGNEKFSRIYLKNFYSNILSFNLNKVEKFEKRTGEKSNVRISGNSGERIISDGKIYFQIKNKSGEKFEISFPTNEKNFKEIFENILNKIGN